MENTKALRGVGLEFVVLCRNLDLFSDALAAIDSSKFKTVNNRDRNCPVARMKRRLEQIDKSIDRYKARHDVLHGTMFPPPVAFDLRLLVRHVRPHGH